MWTVLILTVNVALVCSQNNEQEAINNIFTTSGFPAIDGYEEVTQKPQGSLGAIEKCGEGSTKGVNICVPYYMCDGKTNTVVQTGKTDGFGIISIRFGDNSCDHPLDVCCKVPSSNEQPSTSPPPDPSSSPESKKPHYCGIRNGNGIDFKITGNNHNEAEYGEFPWMVSVLKRNHNLPIDKGFGVCGGSLITPNVVLTGAHCIQSYKPDDLKVRAGEWDTQTDKERLPYQERDVVNIIPHAEFNPQTLYNDVALVILQSLFDEAENIGTVCLPPPNQIISSRNCFASGWGKNVFGIEGQYQMILKKIELPIVEHNQCEAALRSTRLGKHFVLHDSFTCAGGEQGKDTCTGDGGSPLVCPDPSSPTRYVQAGIVAWGIGCGENKVPGVYGDVAKFRDWIDDQLSRLNIDASPYTV